MNWRVKRISFEWIFNEVGRRINSYKGKPVPNDQVASRGRKNIDNVGNGFDSVQCGNKSSKTFHQILGIK